MSLQIGIVLGFPFQSAFYFLSCLITLARLNKSDESRHKCIVMFLKGEGIILSLKNDASFKVFKIEAYEVGNVSLYSFFLILYSVLLLNFVKCFFSALIDVIL